MSMDKEEYAQRFFAAKHKSKNVLKSSSSGGAFTALSDAVLAAGGIVIGSVYNYELHRMEFAICNNSTQRDRMRGSKYIQSNPNDIFQATEKLIQEREKDMPILWVGTPCQVAGFKSYLLHKKIEYSKLYLCDIICHGVASQMVWQDFIAYMEKKHKGKVTKVDFKDKRNGWMKPSTIGVVNGKEFSIASFAQIYISNHMLRPSCYRCPYSNIHRNSDITIGDFWGIEKVHPHFYEYLGDSLIILNSPKGQEIFDLVRPDMDCLETGIDVCLQPNLMHPTAKPQTRAQYWQEYKDKGIWHMCKKYTDVTIGYRIRRKCRKILRLH